MRTTAQRSLGGLVAALVLVGGNGAAVRQDLPDRGVGLLRRISEALAAVAAQTTRGLGRLPDHDPELITIDAAQREPGRCPARRGQPIRSERVSSSPQPRG